MSDLKTGKNRATRSAKDTVLENPGATQLSRLSSVLNGLEGGASAMCRRTQEAIRAVRSGTYKVDPIQLSRRIVGDALRAF
jgi:hypothetical protein